MARLEGTAPGGKAGINEQKVTSEGQALVRAVSTPDLEHSSEVDGAAYNWSSKDVNIDAGDTILLVKNTSDTSLHINTIEVGTATNTTSVVVHLPTSEVTPTGTAVTGTNINTGSSNVADALAKSDETNNTQGNVLRIAFLASNSNIIIDTPGVILGKNKSIGIDVVNTTQQIAATVIGHYED